MDYEISPDYFPISPNSIEANTKVGFNLYLRAKTTAEVRFVLYCNENAVFDADKKDTLMVKNISRLFIKKDDLKIFCSGILLHDIGKTRISTEILNKKGSLTKEEFEEIKKHPDLGVKVLEETGIEFKEERIITLQHHENDDGSGYPLGLKKDEIPNCSKIVRIIDVYDALTTSRPYAKAIRPFAALVEMEKKMIHCFDADLLKEFIYFLGPYDPRNEKRI